MESEPLLTDPKKPYKIYGWVEEEFKPVLDQYIKYFEEGVEKHS